MANEIRLRSNNQQGTITDNPLTDVATTINSPEFVSLPSVGGTQHLVLILDPLEVNGPAEIVIVTAHTAFSSSVTAIRGSEGSVARTHIAGTTWFHGPIVSDYNYTQRAALSTNRPLTPFEGELIYETDTDYYMGYSGSAWEHGLKLGAWESWTPTLTNITLGSGTVVARYVKIGRTVHYRFVFTFGSGSSVGSDPAFSLPVAHATMELQHNIGSVTYVDANGGDFFGRVLPNTTGLLQYLNSSANWAAPSGTAPFTWASGDQITVTGTYEAA